MMKVIICFGKIRVVVPCKNIHMTVGELQDKACSRYKTIIKKGSDYNVKVQNLAFASDGGILNENDEIDDVIEDKDKLIAIYEEPEDEPFEGTLKKFLSDFQEISMEDKYEDSSSDRSSIRQRQHQQQSYNNANDDDDVITDTSPDMWNENFRRNYRYQSFGKGKIQQMQQQQTSGQQQQFNRLNPAHLYHNNNNNNMTSLADDITNTSHRSTPPPQPPVRTSSNHHQHPPQSPLPWFYRKSRHVRVDTREQLPLGLHLMRYDDPMSGNFCGLLVQSMEEDMRNCNCDVSRLFACGDVIVEINGRILTNYSYEKACRLLEEGESGTEINFRLLPVETSNISFDEHDADEEEEEELQPVTKSSMNESKVEYFPLNSTAINSQTPPPTTTHKHVKQSSTTSSSGQQQQHSTSAILNNVSTYSRKIGKMSKIQLQKDSSGLGFSVTSRDTKVGDVISPIYIKNILSRGAAVKDGRLRIGDRILEINGKETNNLDQRQVVEILRNIPVGSRVDLLISRQHDFIPRQMKQDEVESLNSSVEKSTSKENYQFDIQLNDTGSAGLGISVKGNQNRKTGKGQGIFIKSIFHGGAVWQDGRLKVNDQLIEVNGNSLLGISNEEALNILRTCMLIEGSGMIQVVITRRKTSGGNNSKSTTTTNTTTVTSSYSSGSDVTMGSDATVDDEVENFNRDSIARQSISEKRKNPNFNKYIQTTPSNGGSRRRFELKIPEEKQLKKSNSLESVNGPSINMFYQPKESGGKMSKNFSSSMEDLLKDESSSSHHLHHNPLYNTMTKTRPLNNSFRAALDSSSVSSKSSEVSKNSKFFTFRKPKHVKRENENKKIPTTPYKENHHHHHQRRTTPNISTSSSPAKSARTNLNHKLQSCVDAVTPHHRKSYDVTTPNNSYDDHDDVTTTTTNTMRSSRSKRSLHRSSPSPRSKSVASTRNNNNNQQQTTSETNNKPRYRWDVPHHLPQFTNNMTTTTTKQATNNNIIVDTTQVRRPRPRTVYYDDIDDVTTIENVMMTSSSSSLRHQHAKEHQQQKFYVIDQRNNHHHHHRHRRPASTTTATAGNDDIKATVPFPL